MALDLGLDRVQAQLERFAKLPRPYRMAAVPLLCAVVLGLYGYLFWQPAHNQLLAVQSQERDLQRQVSEVRAIVSNLAAFQKELGDLEQQLKLALRQLPDSKELPVLLTDISSLGKDAGLEFKLFRPRDEVERDFYAEVPIEIEFSGTYHDIARFFDKISKLPRIVNVTRLDMTVASRDLDGTRLTVKGEATTFRFIERDATQQPGAVKPQVRGRRSASAETARGGRS